MTRAALLSSVLASALLGALLAAAPPLAADVLELADGRFVEGVVVEDGDQVRVLSRFGETVVAASSVKAREAARPVDEQIRVHLASLAPDDAENRALLAKWLLDLGREEEGRAMAEAVLEIDPESATAHQVLGHVRHQGVWRTPEEAKRAEGLEEHGGVWYAPEEWANVSGAARAEALERERQAEAQRVQLAVNRAVRLMTSPDPRLRERGQKQLETLAAELGNPSLAELARNVAEYVRKLDELAAAEASAATSGGDRGMVLGDIRATVSRLKRPIETFTTSLASNIGGAPVKIQLPELEVIKVRTTGAIPVVVR